MTRERKLVLGALAGLACAVPSCAWLWGFTVDDALISARVAAHLRSGVGYRFNGGGPVVDAVTPLGWAPLLALLGPTEPLGILRVARWLGALAWVVAAAWLGSAVAERARSWPGWLPLLALLPCAPLGAWAVAGMETGLVVAAATFALARRRLAPLMGGLAAAWRPELLPWATVLAVGTALAGSARERQSLAASGAIFGATSGATLPRQRASRVVEAASMAMVPALAVACLRWQIFGRPVPLATLAKPPDTDHGLFYAAAALLWCGAPLLVLAPRAARRAGGEAMAVLVAAAVHWVVLIGVGGDWMPLFRLATPVLPGLVLAGALLAEHGSRLWLLVRVGAATAVSGVLLLQMAPSARRVCEHRRELGAQTAPLLAGAKRVATLDVGWVGATTDADIVDLAGVTDPEVARLSGGHTSKRIPAGWLRARGVDAAVLLLEPGARPATPWIASRFARAVEERVARQGELSSFVPVGTRSLGGTSQSYLVVRAQAGAAASGR